MKNTFKKLLTGAALLTASTLSYGEGLPFTFDATSVGGTQFTAASMTGFYNEKILVNGLTGEFDATILLDFTSFRDVDDNGLRGTGLGGAFGLYGIINVSGALTSGAPNFATGNWSGNIELWLDGLFDTNSNVSSAVVGINDVQLTGDGEDLLLFSSSVAGGQSNGTEDSASFSLASNDVGLTTDGENYFVSPDPFYDMLVSFGNLEDFFAEVDFTSSELQQFAGEANVQFVPEPSGIALLGLSLAGLAFSARRRKA